MLARDVLTPDVRFEGWTTQDWIRFTRLWQPRATPDREPTRPRGGVIVVHEDGQVLKLLHTKHGRLDPAYNNAGIRPVGYAAGSINAANAAESSAADLLSAWWSEVSNRRSRGDVRVLSGARMATSPSSMLWPRTIRALIRVPSPVRLRGALAR